MSAFNALVRRETALAWDGGGGAAAPLAFFLSAAALGAFAVGSDLTLLRAAGPGVLVLAFALTAILGLEHLYQADLESGALDQLALAGPPLEAVALAKIVARAFICLGPAAVAAPLGAVMLGAPPLAALAAPVTLLIAAPGLVAAGATGAALAAGRARGGMLIAVITPPLMAPNVIFAAGALSMATGGEPIGSTLLLGAAASLFGLAVGVVGAAAGLRMQLS